MSSLVTPASSYREDDDLPDPAVVYGRAFGIELHNRRQAIMHDGLTPEEKERLRREMDMFADLQGIASLYAAVPRESLPGWEGKIHHPKTKVELSPSERSPRRRRG